jgi:FtsK/SpoIIIE family
VPGRLGRQRPARRTAGDRRQAVRAAPRPAVDRPGRGRRARGRRRCAAERQDHAAARPDRLAGADPHAARGPVLPARLRRRRAVRAGRAPVRERLRRPAGPAALPAGHRRADHAAGPARGAVRPAGHRLDPGVPPAAAEPRDGRRFGDVVLVVDGWQGLRQEHEQLEAAVTDLAARGLGFGIHVVLSVNRWVELRSALGDMIGTNLELRLGDPLDSMVDRRTAATVPAGQRARHHQGQAAPPRRAATPGRRGRCRGCRRRRGRPGREGDRTRPRSHLAAARSSAGGPRRRWCSWPG